MLAGLRISGFSSLLVFWVPKKFSGGTVTAVKPFSHRGRAVTTKEKDVVREMKKERERFVFEFELASLCPSNFVGSVYHLLN